MYAYKGDMKMKLIVLEELEKLPEGIGLEYEAVEGKITIIIGYCEMEQFKLLNLTVNCLIGKFLQKGFNVSYDNSSHKYIVGKFKHYRYVALRPVKGDK